MWNATPQQGDLPPARSSHSVCYIDGCLLVFGGEQQPRIPLPPDTFCFDTASQTWSRLVLDGTPPAARVGHSAAALGDVMLVFAGRTSTDMATSALNDLHALNLSRRCWLPKVTQGAPPEPRSYHSSAVLSGDLFVFGGCGANGRLNDLYCFHGHSGTWEKMPHSNDITPRGGAGLTAVGSSLYVVGGFCGHELADVHIFESTTRTWTRLILPEDVPQLPPRSVFGMATAKLPGKVGDSLLVFGGEVEPTDQGHAGAGSYSNDLYALELAAPQGGWQSLSFWPGRPSCRGWVASTAVAGGLIVHGGNSPDNSRLDDMFLLSLEAEA